ncbi:MAG: DUF4276 family protein, partial [Phycisphaerales bacterium JB063]
PYVQLHEFEALAFSDVDVLAEVTAPLATVPLVDRLARHYQEILDVAGHPEAINDSYETCPSRRISSKVPAYRKPVHGVFVTKRIGLAALRTKCTHFATWLAKLESV